MPYNAKAITFTVLRVKNHKNLKELINGSFRRHHLQDRYGKSQSVILFCFRTTHNYTVLNVGPNHYFGANVKYFELFAIVG